MKISPKFEMHTWHNLVTYETALGASVFGGREEEEYSSLLGAHFHWTLNLHFDCPLMLKNLPWPYNLVGVEYKIVL